MSHSLNDSQPPPTSGGDPPRNRSQSAESGVQSAVLPSAATVELEQGRTQLAPKGAPATGQQDYVGQVLGRYRVEERLGEGGMGVVYRARHIHMKNPVALKVLHPEMTTLPEVVARFEREAVAAARVEHKNVAKATDFGKTDTGAFYLALEFVEGRRLTEVLEREGRLPAQRALAITLQILEALCAAHAVGIVHRDLKPDNIMLVARDNGPELVKVLDFGIAKVLLDDGQKLTQVGAVFGTPEYMSPEQAQGGAADGRADLYTVGVMLYEMLAGENPFRSGDLIATLGRQMTVMPPRLQSDVSDDLNTFVMELLQKKPEDRLQTAELAVERVRGLQYRGLKGRASAVDPTQGLAIGRRSKALWAEMRSKATALGGQMQGRAGKVATRLRQRALRPSRPRVKLPSFANAAPTLFERRAIFGGRMPNWVFLASLGGLLMVAGFVAALSLPYSAAQTPPAVDDSGPVPDPVGQSLKREIDEAAQGDRAALAALQHRPEAERTAREWRALGAGLLKINDHEASLVAYQHALRKDPGFGQQDATIEDLLALVGHAPITEQTLQLMLTLGTRGPDTVFDIWSRAGHSKEQAQLAQSAKKIALSEDSERRASPALRVVLRLHKARSCKSFKATLPAAAKYADHRALPALLALTNRRGCGLLKLGDCYSCLRHSRDLSRAIARAKATAAPHVPTPKAKSTSRGSIPSKAALKKAGPN